MRNLVAFTVLLSVIQTVSLTFAAPQSSKPVIAVVVAKGQNAQALKLTPKNLNLIYWRKQRYWPHGVPIKPVNLNSKHMLRSTFSKTVLGSLPKNQVDYWNGQYFNGIKPPYSVDSEEAVIRYISQTKGAIGYIDACHIDERVTPLLWINNGTVKTRRPVTLTCQ